MLLDRFDHVDGLRRRARSAGYSDRHPRLHGYRGSDFHAVAHRHAQADRYASA